jgi:hypothetical protein
MAIYVQLCSTRGQHGNNPSLLMLLSASYILESSISCHVPSEHRKQWQRLLHYKPLAQLHETL